MLTSSQQIFLKARAEQDSTDTHTHGTQSRNFVTTQLQHSSTQTIQEIGVRVPLVATDLSSVQSHPALGPNEPPIQLVLGALCSEPKCQWVRSGPCAAISAQVNSQHGAVRLQGRAYSWCWDNRHCSQVYICI